MRGREEIEMEDIKIRRYWKLKGDEDRHLAVTADVTMSSRWTEITEKEFFSYMPKEEVIVDKPIVDKVKKTKKTK
jgi:hypothetical protein